MASLPLRMLGAAVLLAGLSACGQRGPLYLPSEPAAAGQATLPQTLVPAMPSTTADPATTKTKPTKNTASAP